MHEPAGPGAARRPSTAQPTPRATVIAAAAGIVCGATLFAVWVLAIRSPLSPSPMTRAPNADRTEAMAPASPTSTGSLLTPVPTAPAAAAEAPSTAALPAAAAPISTAPPIGIETARPAPSEGAISAPPSTAAGTALAERIKQAMEAIIPGGSAVFVDREARLYVRHNAAQRRTSASVIKLGLLLEVLRQESNGDLDPSAQQTITRRDVVGGSGVLQHQVGRTVSLRELTELTILESDNVAANILLDKVGLKQVNATLQSQGFADTRFERRFLDTAAQQRGAENWTTAEDLAGMLLALWNHELLDPKISTQMLALLKQRGEQDPDWLGRGLPKNVTLYHINGTLDRTRNDAGIVELAPGKGYILVICQDGLTNDLIGEANIVELARRVHALVTGSGGPPS